MSNKFSKNFHLNARQISFNFPFLCGVQVCQPKRQVHIGPKWRHHWALEHYLCVCLCLEFSYRLFNFFNNQINQLYIYFDFSENQNMLNFIKFCYLWMSYFGAHHSAVCQSLDMSVRMYWLATAFVCELIRYKMMEKKTVQPLSLAN